MGTNDQVAISQQTFGRQLLNGWVSQSDCRELEFCWSSTL